MAEKELGVAASPEAMEISPTKNVDVVQNEPGPHVQSNLTMFHDGINHCIDKCLDAKVFATCYKPLWDKSRDMFEELIQQAISQTKDKVKEQLETSFATEDLAESLGLMNELMKESKIANVDKLAWRPTGDPEADSRAYFMAIKKRKLEELENELQKTKSQEELLARMVQERREEFSSTEDKIKAVLNDVDSIYSAAEEFQLRNESNLNSLKGSIGTTMHFDPEPDSVVEK